MALLFSTLALPMETRIASCSSRAGMSGLQVLSHLKAFFLHYLFQGLARLKFKQIIDVNCHVYCIFFLSIQKQFRMKTKREHKLGELALFQL